MLVIVEVGEVPAFETAGRLPMAGLWVAGASEDECSYFGHTATFGSINHTFAERYPDSSTRKQFLFEIERTLDWVRECVEAFTMIISGELVVDVLDPKDAYLALIIPDFAYEQMTARQRWLIRRLLPQDRQPFGDTAEMTYGMSVLYSSEDHPDYELGYESTTQQRWYASRPSAGRVAGYVEIAEALNGWVR